MDEVERVFRQLVDVIADEHPDQLHSPIQASEIYQTLLPYRRFRSALRFDTNQDYEMAVLRLLAGTHGYVSVEPPQAQDELRSEADSVNPNPGAIRDHAAAKVFLNASIVRQILNEREAFAPPEPEEQAPDYSDVEEAEIESFGVDRYELDEVSPVPAETVKIHSPTTVEIDPPTIKEEPDDIPQDLAEQDTVSEIEEEYAFPDDETEPEAEEEVEVPVAIQEDQVAEVVTLHPSTCVSCGWDLPAGKDVVFCPYCGTNQTKLSCSQCGEGMEPAWAFCIACGVKPES